MRGFELRHIASLHPNAEVRVVVGGVSYPFSITYSEGPEGGEVREILIYPDGLNDPSESGELDDYDRCAWCGHKRQFHSRDHTPGIVIVACSNPKCGRTARLSWKTWKRVSG